MRAPGSLAFSPSIRFLAAALNWMAYAFTSSRHSPSSERTRCDGMQPRGASPLNQMWRAPRLYSLCIHVAAKFASLFRQFETSVE